MKLSSAFFTLLIVAFGASPWGYLNLSAAESKPEVINFDISADSKYVVLEPCDRRDTNFNASKCTDVAFISAINSRAQHYLGSLNIEKQGLKKTFAHGLSLSLSEDPKFKLFSYEEGYKPDKLKIVQEGKKYNKAWFIKTLTAKAPTGTLDHAVVYVEQEDGPPVLLLVGKSHDDGYIIRRRTDKQKFAIPQKISAVVTEVTGHADINPDNVYYWLARAIFEGTRANAEALCKATNGVQNAETEQNAFNDFVADVGKNASQDADSFTQAMVLLFENGYPELVAKTVVVAKTITQDKAAVLGPKIVSLCKDIINWAPLVTLVETTPQQPSGVEASAHLKALEDFSKGIARLLSPKNVAMPEFVELVLSNKICHLAEDLLTRQITSKDPDVVNEGTIWAKALDSLINALLAKEEYKKVLEKILKSLIEMGAKHGVTIDPSASLAKFAWNNSLRKFEDFAIEATKYIKNHPAETGGGFVDTFNKFKTLAINALKDASTYDELETTNGEIKDYKEKLTKAAAMAEDAKKAMETEIEEALKSRSEAIEAADKG